ncbi:MAG: hypothetical protein IJB21_06515 [Bacilli bacterium]|nr:hypothetical protein [Bacilli bacterium]
MIDIHSHVIFDVDDGACDIGQSIKIIEEMISVGVTDLICTPHYRLKMFETDYEKIKTNFNALCDKVLELNLNINLYLGREVYFNKSIYNNLELFTMNNNKIILIEFSYTINPDVEEVLYNLKRLGYIVIIAHVERYVFLSFDDIVNLKSKNVYIQINASTIVGRGGRKEKKRALKLIKAGVVDFIASDIHYNRTNYLNQAYNIIYKKFGQEISDRLFNENAKFIINKQEE